jgi:endo-1,4-beta-mannosidase
MVLTRVNSITKVEYRDDPAIFGWELINEPRCSYESNSNSLQVSCHSANSQLEIDTQCQISRVEIP